MGGLHVELIAMGIGRAEKSAAARGAGADEFEKAAIDALGSILVGQWRSEPRAAFVSDVLYDSLVAAAARFTEQNAAKWQRVLATHAGAPAEPLLRLVSEHYALDVQPAPPDSVCVVTGVPAAWVVQRVAGAPPNRQNPTERRGEAQDGTGWAAPRREHAVCTGVYEALRLAYTFCWYEHLRNAQLHEMARREVETQVCAAPGAVLGDFVHGISTPGGECGAMYAFYTELTAAVERVWDVQ